MLKNHGTIFWVREVKDKQTRRWTDIIHIIPYDPNCKKISKLEYSSKEHNTLTFEYFRLFQASSENIGY